MPLLRRLQWGMNEEGLGRAIHGAAHYENFPVASWLLPPAMRAPVLALYRFARAGDDLADEGDRPTAERLQGLAHLEAGLLGLAQGRSTDAHLFALGQRLRDALQSHGLSPEPALALLEAFRYDADFRPFEDWASVDAYCERSANPVGLLVLGFAGLRVSGPVAQLTPAEQAIRRASDAICTGLQLVNFAQDLHEDLARGRPTLPQSDWPAPWQGLWHASNEGSPHRESGPDAISLTVWAKHLSDGDKVGITLALAERGLQKLISGQELPHLLRQALPEGRLRLPLEIAATLLGGIAMGEAICGQPLAPWTRSLRLSKARLIGMIPQAMSMTFFHRSA